MARTPTRTDIVVKVDVRLGPASLAQKETWHKFWTKLTSQINDELKAENEAKHDQT